MSFITDGHMKEIVADALKVNLVDLPAYWGASIIPQANEAAYQEILGSLLNRGFTKAQVDQWDRGAEFQRDQALYFSLRRGGIYAGFDQSTIQALDRRAELKSVLVFVAGQWIKPSGDQPGMVVTSGPNAQGGIFNWPDPANESLGQYTEW